MCSGDENFALLQSWTKLYIKFKTYALETSNRKIALFSSFADMKKNLEENTLWLCEKSLWTCLQVLKCVYINSYPITGGLSLFHKACVCIWRSSTGVYSLQMHFEELLVQMISSTETKYANKLLLINSAWLVEGNINQQYLGRWINVGTVFSLPWPED